MAALFAAAVLMMASITVQAEENPAQQEVVKAKASSADAVEVEDLYDGLEPESVLLRVGDDEIPLKKAYFLVKFQQSIVQDMQKNIYGANWYNLEIYEGDRTFQENMKDSIEKLLVRMSLAKQYQEELGISLSNKERESIAAATEQFMASNSDEALAAMMADEEVVTEVLEDYTLLSKAIAALTKDVTVEYGEAKTYAYVYGSFGEDAGTRDFNDVSEETETMLEAFNNIYNTAGSGTDFETAAAQQGYPTALHTYFEGDSRDALAEFNEAMQGLEIGEISKPVYVGDNAGVFIGCMQEIDEESLADARQSLLKSEQLKELGKTIDKWLGETTTSMNEEIWSQVTMKKSIAAYRTESE